ncbi:MAG: amidohydrolase, partial [Micrococcales bacterium]|nr:amidohydrolase [Micrococcales bacterium]
VPIYVGTDAGGVIGHGRVADEIAELAALGGSGFALGAASWRARDWLGTPWRLQDGDPADLVIYDADPRKDVRVTANPSHVILRGRVVAGA